MPVPGKSLMTLGWGSPFPGPGTGRINRTAVIHLFVSQHGSNLDYPDLSRPVTRVPRISGKKIWGKKMRIPNSCFLIFLPQIFLPGKSAVMFVLVAAEGCAVFFAYFVVPHLSEPRNTRKTSSGTC
jgi:hypothetical protein